MTPEFSGIERRLDELDARLSRLSPLQGRPRADFDADPYLRDIVERTIEIAAQCVIDTCNRIISLEGAQRSADYYEAIVRMGDLSVVSPAFARQFAPIAGFRYVLVHEYTGIDWNEVYDNLQELEDRRTFADAVRKWKTRRESGC